MTNISTLQTPRRVSGSILIKIGEKLARVFIGQRSIDYTAAVVVNGSVWCETGLTPAWAINNLAERLKRSTEAA